MNVSLSRPDSRQRTELIANADTKYDSGANAMVAVQVITILNHVSSQTTTVGAFPAKPYLHMLPKSIHCLVPTSVIAGIHR